MTEPQPIALPAFPSAKGPAAAQRLQSRRDTYVQTASSLRRALTSVDDTLTSAFDVADRRAATRDRVQQAADEHRKNRR